MSTIGNCFAFLILAITMIVFFSIKYHLTRASYYYTVCLISTLISTIVNILRIEAITHLHLSSAMIKLFATLDFMLMIFTTSILALYLISKICEHVDGENHLFYAKLVLTLLFSLLCVVLVLNLPLGFIFSSPVSGAYQEGVAFYLPYLFLIPQIALLIIYCIKYQKKLAKNIKIALIESILIIVFCNLIKLIYDSVSIFVLSIVLIELIFFLNFQNHRMGVNSLTNLNGSRGFFKEINARIKKQTPFKVYLIKLQNLDIIRQNYGQKIGNEMLYRFAFNLEKLFSHASAFNPDSTMFTLALPYTSHASAEENETLFTYLEQPFNYNGISIKLDYIVAEHLWQGENEDAEAIYEQLEYATNTAIESKLKYVCCTPDLDTARTRQQYLINRLQTVSREAGFEIWFQPIFSITQNSFSSMEALLRLKEPDGSFISPAEFIPLAEKTGQIIPITWFVIEEACRALANLKELRGKRVSINLPMVQLADPTFDKTLDEIVDRYGIAHNRISFEFTERVIIDDLNLAEKNMRKLKRSGYTFYLDDFGTGYSNFNCVLKLPLKTVKLDMSLTSTVEKTQKNNLVCILTDLFHDMGLKVVAEGAETEEQVLLLNAYGVDGIQGYYLARPMPQDKLLEFLRETKKHSSEK